MVFVVPGGNPSGSDRCGEYMNSLYDGNDARVPDDDLIVNSERKAWREYCASIFRNGLGPFPSDPAVSPPRGERRDELLPDESDWKDLYDVAGRQCVDNYNFDVPGGMDLMVCERGGGRLDQK